MAVKDARYEVRRLQAWLEYISWEGNACHIETEWADVALKGAETPESVQSTR